MMQRCESCGRGYDDAVCWTICPHQPLGSPNVERADATAEQRERVYCREHDMFRCPLHDDSTNATDLYGIADTRIGPEGAAELRRELGLPEVEPPPIRGLTVTRPWQESDRNFYDRLTEEIERARDEQLDRARRLLDEAQERLVAGLGVESQVVELEEALGGMSGEAVTVTLGLDDDGELTIAVHRALSWLGAGIGPMHPDTKAELGEWIRDSLDGEGLGAGWALTPEGFRSTLDKAYADGALPEPPLPSFGPYRPSWRRRIARRLIRWRHR